MPERPPLELWVVLVLFALGAVVATPQIFIALGPFRESLTSDVASIRATAELTVLVARVALVFCALAVAVLLVLWRRVASSDLLTPLAACRELPVDASLRAVVARRSLVLSVSAFALAVCYATFISQMLSLGLRDAIGREDGVIEQATAAFFFAAACVAFAASVRALGLRHMHGPTAVRRSVWLLLLGLFFVLCVGEEISWGQRIFGFETTEAFQEVNVQGEMNIHNAFGYLADYLFIAGVLVYGAVLPWLASRYEFWRRLTSWLGLPLATTGLAVGFLLVSTIHDWTLYRIVPYTSEVRAAELRELLSAFCLLLLTIECWVLTRSSSSVDVA